MTSLVLFIVYCKIIVNTEIIVIQKTAAPIKILIRTRRNSLDSLGGLLKYIITTNAVKNITAQPSILNMICISLHYGYGVGHLHVR